MKRFLIVLSLLLFGMSVYGGAQTCSAFPCVVASVSLTSQSQALPVTNLYTPANGGIFRIGVYMTTSTGTNKNATWELIEGWTDNNGARQGGYLFNLPNVANSSTWVVQSASGQPLVYQTKLYHTLGGSGGMTYNLNFIVEQLQ